jgi:hypothetical protein
MDRAGASAQSTSESIVGVTLAIAGVGVAVAGAIAGPRSFVDYVGQQTQQLVDLSDHAQLAGVSVKELQQTLFAASSAGVSDKDSFCRDRQDRRRPGAGEPLISTRQALADIMGWWRTPRRPCPPWRTRGQRHREIGGSPGPNGEQNWQPSGNGR